MCPDPREELADIANQAAEYVAWLKEDGVSRIEVGGEMPFPLAPKPATAPASRPAPQPVPRKPVPAPVPVAAPAPAPAAKPAPVRVQGDEAAQLAGIAAEISVCTRCSLHQTRTKTVPGQGNPRPELMFVGEAPGADEDLQGLAFVGKAGQLLTRMIEAMGFCREEVFIANIAKCRPPENRQPTPEEMETCMPYLRRQIALVQPKVIVALGAVAVRGLLQNPTGITRLRGTWQDLDGIPVMPTYHPAYLLRNPPSKREVWADLQTVLKRLGRTPPPVKKAG